MNRSKQANYTYTGRSTRLSFVRITPEDDIDINIRLSPSQTMTWVVLLDDHLLCLTIRARFALCASHPIIFCNWLRFDMLYARLVTVAEVAD